MRGVLLWNTWDQVDAARALIAEPGPFRPEQLKGRLPAGGRWRGSASRLPSCSAGPAP